MCPAHSFVASGMCGETEINESIFAISQEAKFSSSFYSVCAFAKWLSKGIQEFLLVHSSTAQHGIVKLYSSCEDVLGQ